MDRSTKIIAEAYLDFVRQNPCICGGGCGDVVAHHVKARGRGEAMRNDFLAVPLGVKCHAQIHNVGMEQYGTNRGVNVWQEAVWLLIEFFVIKEYSTDPAAENYFKVTFGKSSLPR